MPFTSDIAGDQGAVGGFDNIRQPRKTCLMRSSQCPHPGKNLGLSCRSCHLETVAFESGGIAHTQCTLCQQGNDLIIKRINAMAQPGQRGRHFDVAGDLEAPNRGCIYRGFWGVIHASRAGCVSV